MTLPQEQRQEVSVSGGATPGPWTAVEIGQGGPWDAPMPIYEIHAGSGPLTVVAEFVDGRNAPLITAAPALLDALKKVIEWGDDNGKQFKLSVGSDSGVMTSIRAAIALATGKAA